MVEALPLGVGPLRVRRGRGRSRRGHGGQARVTLYGQAFSDHGFGLLHGAHPSWPSLSAAGADSAVQGRSRLYHTVAVAYPTRLAHALYTRRHRD